MSDKYILDGGDKPPQPWNEPGDEKNKDNKPKPGPDDDQDDAA